MKTDDIRKKYLEFFRSKGHTVLASDSLVPQNDPTLLFTGAGMNQFKEYFLGIKKDLKRATTSQKCLRTGDLDEVGRTAFHHSFFEMLGNFSFGDYFKKEAIHWAWEFLTGELKIAKDRLRISVHESDDEAYSIWKNEIGIRPDWIYKMGDKSNFWPANAPQDGPNGPCGPCSEIYYDQRPAEGDGGHIEDGSGRFAEIWNLVFTQFDRQDGGTLVPLAQKNIDTGMGLERLACVLQGKSTNYEIELFQTINSTLENALGYKTGAVQGKDRSHLYALSDHVRAVTFSMADGVIPSNEGRGYVIRKLIRRALWRARQILANVPGPTSRELTKPFLNTAVSAVVSVMGTAYPELRDASPSIASTIRTEEERFLQTLETGLRILSQKISDRDLSKSKIIPGQIVFELYDTYGFPDELTHMIAESRGLEIDRKGFESLMEEQRKRGKQATQISGAIFVATELEKILQTLPPTEFMGYGALESQAKVLHADFKGNEGVLILDKSPFYGESGGQVGDKGWIAGKNFKAEVLDSQKKDHYILHGVQIKDGKHPQPGDEVTATVERGRRENTMRNHTATHLLHAALRSVLGSQVRQLGSLVAPDKLRFDYAHSSALTPEEMKKIEDLVNAEILQDKIVTKEEKSAESAKKEGALAFFGEKYGTTVRVISIPGFSMEFCGGTHCDRTGQIGAFVITSDSSIASGTRRIEALTGEGALDYLRNLRAQVTELAQYLKTSPDKLGERVAKLQDSLKKLEKEKSRTGGFSPDTKTGNETTVEIGSLKFIARIFKGLPIEALRKQSDEMRANHEKTVYFLGAENEDKIHFVAGVSHDLAKAGPDMRELGKQFAARLGGNCGGRQDLVQGGAPNQGQLPEQLTALIENASEFLKQKVS